MAGPKLVEEEEEGGGAFLTSVSLDEPALDYTTETQCATGPEPSEDGTDKDEVLVFLEAQAKRRRELQGYVASVRDQGGASGAVAVPSDFADRVATMVRTSVGKKRDFLKELRGLGERHLADQGEKEWEKDAKISSGLDKIKRLDDQLNKVEGKLKILSGELSATLSASSGGSSGGEKNLAPEGSAALQRHKSNFLKDAKLKRVLGPVKDRDDLQEHEKRNAEMASLGTQAGRWFTLSEEEAAMVAEVLARDDDAFEGEGDPYREALRWMGEGEEGEGEAQSEGRLAEIDRKLEELSQRGGAARCPVGLAGVARPGALLTRLGDLDRVDLRPGGEGGSRTAPPGEGPRRQDCRPEAERAGAGAQERDRGFAETILRHGRGLEGGSGGVNFTPVIEFFWSCQSSFFTNVLRSLLRTHT